MISVLPGQSFQFKNPTDKKEIDRIVGETIRLIRGASPFVESIEFLNRTKYCTVDVAFHDKKIQVIFRNPKDDDFDLNEMENPVTPLQITRR